MRKPLLVGALVSAASLMFAAPADAGEPAASRGTAVSQSGASFRAGSGQSWQMQSQGWALDGSGQGWQQQGRRRPGDRGQGRRWHHDGSRGGDGRWREEGRAWGGGWQGGTWAGAGWQDSADDDWQGDAPQRPADDGIVSGRRFVNPCRGYRWDGWSWRCRR